jgi:antirestriction protein ArdC
MAGSDAYQVVTERIIAAIEAGVVPWAKPWRTLAGFGPTSVSTGRPYKGVNVMILGATAMVRGYTSPYWLTFNQARSREGSVRKGEKSTPIVFWKWIEKKDAAGDVIERYGFLRYFSVFNVEQTEGCENLPEPPEAPEEFDPIEAAELVCASMPQAPQVKHSPKPSAYYSPLLDYVHLPLRAAFTSAESYYATRFHELVHATGHSTRLNRPGIETVSPFGSEDYSREELVAEMGAAFVCGEVGIEPRVDAHAAYVAGWLKALKNDTKLVVQAASQAAKAADWILDRKEEEDDQENE